MAKLWPRITAGRLCGTVLLVFGLAVGGEAIRCYKCSDFKAEFGDKCPGAQSVSFSPSYNTCIIYRLQSGRIVYQDVVDPHTSSCEKSQDFFNEIFMKNFGEKGKVKCCTTNACNKDLILTDDEDKGEAESGEPEKPDDSSSTESEASAETAAKVSDGNGCSANLFSLAVLSTCILVLQGFRKLL